MLCLLEFKGLTFRCWNTCVTYALNPGSYSIGFGFDHFPPSLILIVSGCITLVSILPWGFWPLLLTF